MSAVRVAIFRPTLGDGGADRVTLTLLRHLDRAKIHPTLCLVRRSGVLLDQVPADVPVVDLGASRLATATLPLVRWLRESPPDVLFSTSSGCNAIAVAARSLARQPMRLVLSERNAVHRPNHHPARRALEVRLKRLTYRRADLVTAVSGGVADDLIRALSLPPSAVEVVGNPVVTDDFDRLAAEPVDHPWFAESAPVLLAVGRLVEQKDYPTLLAAFARIAERSAARLLILGEGALRAELEAKAVALGLGGRVEFLGFDPNPYRYMKRAYALLQSSVAEGLPGTIIQAMAAGTPVVATDCDHGPREVILPGHTGYLVPMRDPTALADRALTLIADPALRNRLGARARIEALAHHSMSAALDRYTRALLGPRQR